MSDIKTGDRVRVTLEGVARVSDQDIILGDGSTNAIFRLDGSKDYTVSIEKIEPPVATFKPGDIVIRKFDGEPILLGREGYTYLRDSARGNSYHYGTGGHAWEYFTSARFDRADSYLVEA